MFRRPTTIIVGAGASQDYGLPLGVGLRNDIASLINIGFDDWGSSLKTGDYEIVEALRHVARERNFNSINNFIPACRQMAEAMPLSLSIDNYLDAHQDNADVLLCGKLAISRAILKAEHNSSLFYDHRHRDGFDLSSLQKTWLAKLVNVLTEGVPKSKIIDIFENLTIISFNYDRCIKTFLRQALSVYYGLDVNQINIIMEKLKVFHPYGSVGALPYETPSGVAFGSDRGGELLLEVSKGIKTFTEQIDDDDLVEEMRSSVCRSEHLIFLGFAFHRQNIELISPYPPRSCQRVFATTMGISHSDTDVIRDELNNSFKSENNDLNFMPIQGNYSALFEGYWRSITS